MLWLLELALGEGRSRSSSAWKTCVSALLFVVGSAIAGPPEPSCPKGLPKSMIRTVRMWPEATPEHARYRAIGILGEVLSRARWEMEDELDTRLPSDLFRLALRAAESALEDASHWAGLRGVCEDSFEFTEGDDAWLNGDDQRSRPNPQAVHSAVDLLRVDCQTLVEAASTPHAEYYFKSHRTVGRKQEEELRSFLLGKVRLENGRWGRLFTPDPVLVKEVQAYLGVDWRDSWMDSEPPLRDVSERLTTKMWDFSWHKKWIGEFQLISGRRAAQASEILRVLDRVDHVLRRIGESGSRK